MKKNSIAIYYFTMQENLPILNVNDYNKNLNEKKYTFKINIINNTSEYLYNFNLPRYTQCFFAFNTLYIIKENLQYPIKKIADAVFFLKSENLNEKDISLVIDYLKENIDLEDRVKKLKLQKDKRSTKEYLVRSYLFQEKIKKDVNKENYVSKVVSKSKSIFLKDNNDKVKKKVDNLLLRGY